MKDDLAADDFCKREFYATEAAFRAVLMLFNLLSAWQKAARGQEHGYQRPASLRMEVFLCGAIAGSRGHTPVVYLSMSWGGLEKRKPLMDRAKSWCEGQTRRDWDLKRGRPRAEHLICREKTGQAGSGMEGRGRGQRQGVKIGR